MGEARLSPRLCCAHLPLPTPTPHQAICVDDFPDLEYGKVGEIVGLTDDAADDFILVRFPESMPQGYPPQVTNPNPHPHPHPHPHPKPKPKPEPNPKPNPHPKPKPKP